MQGFIIPAITGAEKHTYNILLHVKWSLKFRSMVPGYVQHRQDYITLWWVLVEYVIQGQLLYKVS